MLYCAAIMPPVAHCQRIRTCSCTFSDCRQPQRQPRLQLPPMPHLPPPGQMLQAALGPTQQVAHFVMSTPLHLLAIALQTAQHAADGMTDGALACQHCHWHHLLQARMLVVHLLQACKQSNFRHSKCQMCMA